MLLPLQYVVLPVLPAEGADGVLGLVASIVLVLPSSHVQEAIHHSHTLVEALRRQLGEVAPGGSCVSRVSPQHLGTEVKGQRRMSMCFSGGECTRRTQSPDLAAERSLGERRTAADGEQCLLAAADVCAPGLQGVLLVGQQVVVHGFHQQTVALRVHHHAGHRLDLTHQLAGRDRLKADVRQELCGVGMTRGVKVEPPDGQLERQNETKMHHVAGNLKSQKIKPQSHKTA